MNDVQEDVSPPEPIVTSSPLDLVLAEDDEDLRLALAMSLVRSGCSVTCVRDGEMLLDYLHRRAALGLPPDVVVTDHRMPGYSSFEVLSKIREEGWTMPVIVITAFADEVETLARSLGARAVFRKPFEVDDLLTAITRCTGGTFTPRRGNPAAPGSNLWRKARLQ